MDGRSPLMARRRPPLRQLPSPGPRLRPSTITGAVECPSCGHRFVAERYAAAQSVCGRCGHHGRVDARHRLAQLADPGTAQRLHPAVSDRDPLHFDDGVPYPARVARAREHTGLDEIFLLARAELGGAPVLLACMDFAFLGGSLGSAAGEIFVHGCDVAVRERRSLVAVCTSGGARMQEGIASLAQMARCSTGVQSVATAGIPFISVLADPCFGGVTASFAVQADVILAEPGARIGFAGGRVIEQATHGSLPDGFQTAEFLLAHGMVDAVVDRRSLRRVVAGLLRAYTGMSGGRAP
jgi:acetyl-CoA carboxylase carboxyl transferase subunit beta